MADDDATLADEILSIENELWTGGEETYRRHLDDRCLIAFTEMSGVASRGEVAASVEGGPRWRNVRIEVDGLLQPTNDVAILTYRARADRSEDERYRALVSSGYVRRGGGWKMAFHQQTPLDD